MTFDLLSAAAVAAGVAAIAGAAFALQRLRVRHEERTVVTTLFWHEAVRETRARVLTGRFRHPLAYLLVVSIASLMWLAFAGARFDADDGTEHLVLLDASAGMGVGKRFDAARDRALELAGDLPRARTFVVAAGSRPRTLLRPGENIVVLAGRLAELSPEACGETVSDCLAEWSATASAARPLAVHVVGGARPRGVAALPAYVTVTRALPRSDPVADNRGIVELGVAEARSLAFDRVDVVAVLHGARAGEARFTATLDGAAVVPTDIELPRDGADGVRLRFRDLAASGGVFGLRLADADALAADDRAEIVLPRRTRVRVRLDPALGECVGAALRSDPAFELVEDAADVDVRAGIARDDDATPSLTFVPEDSQDDAILVRHAAGDTSADVVGRAYRELALDRVDAATLAERTGREIRLGARPAAARGVSVWDTLATPSYDFVHARAFPLFVCGSVRWLAGVEGVTPFAAAGVAVPGDTRARREQDGAPLDPLGAAFVPPRAGRFDAVDGGSPDGAAPIVASLLDPEVTADGATDDPGRAALPEDSAAQGGGELATALALGAFVLLLCEWFAFRTGRMP